jgi:8-amino-7-oxononanoate synthase
MSINSVEDYFKEQLKARESKLLLRKWAPILDPLKTDFISNDYLGFRSMVPEPDFAEDLLQLLSQQGLGSSGSRLVSGQSTALESLENLCCTFFKSESSMFFPSGFVANLALLSSVAGRNDTYIYDEQCHVSLKDGMRLSLAKRFSFRHNDMEDLEKKCRIATGNIFIVTEGIFSMEGDLCKIKEIKELAKKYNAHLIVDEAHSTGTLGPEGRGLCATDGETEAPFARIYTFGKSLGASGAVVCTSKITHQYLINFAHPAIYSTSPMPLQAWLCEKQLKRLVADSTPMKDLQHIISLWNKKIKNSSSRFSGNDKSPIQYINVSGNEEGIRLSERLNHIGFQVKPMLSPTVPVGKERLRITLHSFNTEDDITGLMGGIQNI